MALETIVLPRVTTTSATPITQVVRAIAPDSALTVRYSAVARSSAGVVKAWNGVRTLQRVGTSAPAPVGTAITPDVDPSAGAPTWSINAGATGNDFTLTFTGAAATTIYWDVTIHATVNG